MRWNDCTRGALFAAAAGAAAVLWLLAGAPLLGAARALRVFLAVLPAAYFAWTAPRGPARVGVTGAAAIAGAILGCAATTLGELALALGILLAALRSGFVHRLRPGRALLVELAVVGSGLLFARFLAGPSPLAVGLAVWGFFLVQCAFCLVGGAGERAVERDPFEDAFRRATGILDGEGI